MTLNVSFKDNDATFLDVMRDVQVASGDPGSGYAPLDSPAFTGIPTAPTAELTENSGQIATTAYVRQSIAMAHMGYGNIVTLSIDEVTS